MSWENVEMAVKALGYENTPDNLRLIKMKLASGEITQEQIQTAVEKYEEQINPNENLIRKYLQDPELLNLVDLELDKKIVGENDNRKVIFLVANMRNVENLSKGSDNLIVNALSGTGKDHVVGAVFDILPESEKEELIRTTPKVLAYTRNRKMQEAKDDK
jgi:hypothetical protein